MNDNPIGVYDSGLGGLTVWRELRRALPRESLVYLGDGKNCPYGSRPAEEIRTLADRAVATLLDAGCKLVVVACNTATAAAIDFLRAKYSSTPIVGMEPAVKPACLNTRSGVVGVLATARSLEGDLFRRTAARYAEGSRSSPPSAKGSSSWSSRIGSKRPRPRRASAARWRRCSAAAPTRWCWDAPITPS